MTLIIIRIIEYILNMKHMHTTFLGKLINIVALLIKQLLCVVLCGFVGYVSLDGGNKMQTEPNYELWINVILGW